ncbi:MAG: hypothetical protein ACT4PP_15645 [Sporichthyaceae bacterium]
MPTTGSHRRRLLASLSAVAVASLGMLVPSASATTFPPPDFLVKSELPQSGKIGNWNSTKVKDGLPKPQYTCVKGILARSSSQFRTFLGTGIVNPEFRQTVTLYNKVADAKAIVKELKKAVVNCDDRLDDVTDILSYGTFGTADGLAVYGVFTAPPDSEFGLQLFGIGREGNAVVVTSLGQAGKKADAPAAAFVATSKKALAKVY